MTLDRLSGFAIAAGLVARGLFLRRRRRTLAQRLAEFPATAPTSAPLRITWDEHAIPFVEAQSEPDLAVGLGMVHAHLRLGQMELMRRIAQGRVAEMVGPLGIEPDRTLRLLDLSRAVPKIIGGLAPDVRAWAEGFVRGVNHVLASTPLPEEMRLLKIGREPWSLTDLLTSARLAGADVSWIVYARLLRTRENFSPAAWQKLWPLLLRSGMPPLPAAPEGLLVRAGSNAAAVAAWRSATGGALLAADPHLSVALPNIWLIAGMSAPGLNVVGLMPTGFPIVGIGRNPHIAWGGTSLHAAASDLFDASTQNLSERTETLKVRGVGTREITLRKSPLGPVVSDGMLFRHKSPLALRWVGHEPSDEMGAMLCVMRARDSNEFARALKNFGIPGQTMIHATVDGHIGQMLALKSPRRSGPPPDLVLPPSAAETWADLAGTDEFPSRKNPPSGVVASANDPPPPSAIPPGFFYSPATRAERMHELLAGGAADVDMDRMAQIQTDAKGRLDTQQKIVPRVPAEHPAAKILEAWDGCYDVNSQGAVLFEAAMAELARHLPDQQRQKSLSAVWTGRALMADEILSLDDEILQPMLTAALDVAMRLLRRYRRWGGLHRMRLRHYFGAVPVLGRRYDFGAYPSPGGNDTLDKTGHGPVLGPHPVTYGASARFLADMADPDANHGVLLGGQDGFVGSTTFLDQVPLWRAGKYVDLPLRPKTIRERWPHVLDLRPA